MTRDDGSSIPENVLALLKKLFSKAESAREIGSLAEAESFMVKVRQLLEKHKVDMSQLSTAKQDVQEPITDGDALRWEKLKNKREAWIEQLAGIVASHFCCRILVYSKLNYVCLVGRPTDRSMAEYVLIRLVNFGQEECDREYWRERAKRYRETGSWVMSGWKDSWHAGYVSRIAERLKELETVTTTNVALVLRRGLIQVDEFVANRFGKATLNAPRTRRGDSQGFYTGRAAGGRANISAGGIGSGLTDSMKRIT